MLIVPDSFPIFSVLKNNQKGRIGNMGFSLKANLCKTTSGAGVCKESSGVNDIIPEKLGIAHPPAIRRTVLY